MRLLCDALLLAAVGTAWLPACEHAPWSPGTEVTAVSVDDGSQGVWESHVREAVGRWADVLGPDCWEPYRVVPEGGMPVVLVDDSEWTHDEDAIGWWSGDMAEVRHRDGDRQWFPALMHELGHSMGLGHAEGRGHVMSRSPASLYPTAEDVRLAREALGCD